MCGLSRPCLPEHTVLPHTATHLSFHIWHSVLPSTSGPAPLSPTLLGLPSTYDPMAVCVTPPIGYGFLTGNKLTSTDSTYPYALTLRLPPDRASLNVLHDLPSVSLSSSDLFSGATLYAALPSFALCALSLVYVILVVLSDVIFVHLLSSSDFSGATLYAALPSFALCALSLVYVILVVLSDVIFVHLLSSSDFSGATLYAALPSLLLFSLFCSCTSSSSCSPTLSSYIFVLRTFELFITAMNAMALTSLSGFSHHSLT